MLRQLLPLAYQSLVVTGLAVYWSTQKRLEARTGAPNRSDWILLTLLIIASVVLASYVAIVATSLATGKNYMKQYVTQVSQQM